MSRLQIVQPPHTATWLVGLFTMEEQARVQERIHDQFSDMASTWGIDRARRWHWSQSVKRIAGLFGRGLRTAPCLIVGIALGGSWLLQFATGNLQRVIMEIILLLNHHVVPYYDSKHAASQFFWMYYAVLLGSLLESLIIGCFAAMVAKRREVIATLTLSFVSMVMTVTTFWVLVAMHNRTDPALFPKIVIDQLGASLLIVVGGIIVREIRSSAVRGFCEA